MLAPLSWLKEYVDIDVDNQTLENKLFSSGFEVEEIIEVGKDVTGVYVGLVESCEKVEGTHLSVCKVNVGEKGTFQICCGANNVRAGKKFPVALEGATVLFADKQNPSIKQVATIKNTKIRGIESFGMLCSGDELGISENMYDGASYDGLLELDDSLQVGQDLKQAIGLTDFVFDISVTANRPDCQSILGMAREIAAVLEKPFKMPEVSFTAKKGNEDFSVEIENLELCPRYEAHIATDVVVEKSPLWLRKRLELVGIKPINNVVDITNYVLKEIGQPMHAFDKQTLKGNKIVVRAAKDKEEFVALNEEKYTLSENNLVVADAQEAVAIAGVMGGFDSGITENTKEIVFESAKFERSSVRKTSRALGLASDSSSRFEKGVDEFSVNLGRQRALHLLEVLGAGKAVGGAIIVAKNPEILESNVTASVAKINSVLGIEVPNSEIVRVLSNLGLRPQIEGDKLSVTVPAFRSDIETYQDLAEEIIRLYGYDHINSDFLKFVSVTAGQRTKEQKLKNNIRRFFYGQGFMESITYSFFSPKDLDLLKLEENDPLRETIKILNPLKENISLMRTTLAPSMIANVVRNIKRNNQSGKLYEISRVFHAKELPLSQYPEEHEMLSIGVFGKDEDYFSVKGVVEALINQFGFSAEFERANKNFLHPGVSANVLVNGEVVGYFGAIAHDVKDELAIDKMFYIGEIAYHKLEEMFNKKIEYKNIMETVIVKRDLALVAKEELTNGEIEKVIKNSAKNIVSVKLFDIYKGKQIGEGNKSMAYHIDLEIKDDDMQDENANKTMKSIVYNLKTKLNIEVRQ